MGKMISYPYGTLEFPMRQTLTLLLSFGALVLVVALPANSAETAVAAAGDTANLDLSAANNKGVALAEIELRRMTDLVAAGALPRIRVQQAQDDLEDARDEAVLQRTLFGELPAKDQSAEVSKEMLAAAQRRVDRQLARLGHAREIVSAGVAAQSYLLPIQEELTIRQTSLDLSRLRAHMIAQYAAQKAAPLVPSSPASAVEDIDLFAQGMEHYEGDGAFDESRELAPLEFAFANRFARPLPISAEGETEVHRALGFDHRGRVDVAVDPSQPEGLWLRQYLKIHKIPYYAFAHAIPGKATAAHVHIGPGSTRLAPLSTRLTPRAHSAD
jgi:hypothetical protein